MDFQKLSAEQRSSLEASTARYQAALQGSPALTYLEGRGIPAHVAATYRAGFVAEPEQGHEQFEGRLSIPFLTPSGVVGLRFRSIDGREPKYHQAADTSTHLYNVLDLHRGTDYVAICEGELDTLVMSALVGVPAVGLAGVGAWKKFHRRLFEDFTRVFIVQDAWKLKDGELVKDEAGRKAAEKLRSELSNGVIVDLELGDVNETFLAKGPEFIMERLGL